jgi:hypothetical protein
VSAPPFLDPAALAAGVVPDDAPARIPVADGDLVVERRLRVLPGRRLVFAARLDGRPVLAKLFVGRGARRRADRERAGIDRLVAAGLPTPEPVGTRAVTGGGIVVLTEWLDGASDATRAVALAPAAVLEAVGEVVGRAQSAGLAQTDPHLGNFLVRDGAVFLIDGDAVADAPVPDPFGLADQLGRFLAQVPADADAAADGAARLHAGWVRGAGRAAPCDVEAVRRRAGFRRQLRLNHYLAKARRDCTEFVVRPLAGAPGPGWRLVARREDATAAVRSALAGLADRAAAPGTTRVTVADRVYLLRRFRPRTGLDLGGGAGHRAWLAGNAARFLGLPVAAPVALAHRRLGPLGGRALLLAEPPPPGPDDPVGDASVRTRTLRACRVLREAGLPPGRLEWLPLARPEAPPLPLHRFLEVLGAGAADRWPDDAGLDAAVDAFLARHA